MTVKKHTIAYSVLGVLLVAAAGSSVYFYKQASALQKNPQLEAQAQAAATVAQVGKLMILPTDEQPTIATVSDPSKLKDQAFFADAMQGDDVLLYTNAKKAILFRPSADKIVEVAPITTTDTSATAVPASATTASGTAKVTPAPTTP